MTLQKSFASSSSGQFCWSRNDELSQAQVASICTGLVRDALLHAAITCVNFTGERVSFEESETLQTSFHTPNLLAFWHDKPLLHIDP